jgi:predicted transcriptional regulator YdeE
VSLFFALSILVRADDPSTQPSAQTGGAADGPESVISTMRVQEMKGTTFLYVSSKTSLTQLGDHIRKCTAEVDPALKAGLFRPAGPILIIYHGVMQDPTGEYPLEVGFPVADDTKAPDGFEIKKLDKFRCATVLYSGAMQGIRSAFEAVYNDLLNAGLEPTDQSRQSILLYEGPDSINNVAIIEVGVR